MQQGVKVWEIYCKIVLLMYKVINKGFSGKHQTKLMCRQFAQIDHHKMSQANKGFFLLFSENIFDETYFSVSILNIHSLEVLYKQQW